MPETTLNLSGLTLVAVFAHPDDEGFGCGGTLAMLAEKGAKLTLVCVTNGDVGEISDPNLASPETLSEVRQQELYNAMQVTGISDIRFLNYRDSGMANTPDNEHPESLNMAPAHQVMTKLTKILDEINPDLVLTHDPTGGYGHPDHLAVNKHTTTAFYNSRNRSWTSLYYVCFPRTVFQRMWQRMSEMGIAPPFANQDTTSIGSPDEAVTLTLDVSEFVETKITSLNCHKTQMDPNGAINRLPKDFLYDVVSQEYFSLVEPRKSANPSDILGSI